MNNKAVSNIEFVLAFIMFVGFVVAALYFFNPTKDIKAVELSRDYIANEIIRNSSVELYSYSIAIDSNENKFRVYIPDIDSEKRVRVEDYSGTELPATRSADGSVCFEKDGADFVTVYFSEDFEEGTTDCSGAVQEGYRIASSISETAISEKRIEQLKEVYDNDYESLKNMLNIPGNIDFSFSIEFANGYVMSAEKKAPLRAEVFSETELREIIKKGGDMEFAYLTVRVW